MSDPNMIPNNIPPNAGWVTAAVLGLLALGKPALDAWRSVKFKAEGHEQKIELRALNAREQEDRDLILYLKEEVKDLKARLDRVEAQNTDLSRRNTELERENAILTYQLHEAKP